ncbi:hypothetical protein BJY52DRAFT_243744 [Lactarius psammicola]|nr:hypothetical protein BJY52DRAFT_243744 [Lactarius psammicola]
MTRDRPEGLNVVPCPLVPTLVLKPDYVGRVTTASFRGEDKHWSSSGFRQHLELLKGLVPYDVSTPYHVFCGGLKLCKNGASTRVWVDAFFRVSAMARSDMYMVLNLGQAVPWTVVHPSTSTALSGYIDYTAVIVNRCCTCELIILHWDQQIDGS